MNYYAAPVRRTFASAVAAYSGNREFDRIHPSLDSLSLQFVIWAQTARSKALDVACGDGLVARTLLARGGSVLAVDRDAAALHRLVAGVPPDQCRRLQVRLGQVPQMDFKLANFAAIHAPHALEKLELEEARLCLRKFCRWLYPEGKLFVSTLTPRGAEGRMKSDQGNPLDEAALCREVVAADMLVEQSFTYLPPWSGAPECCAVIARCLS